MADVATTKCPFCDQCFESVGKHLPRCKERHGRDYKQFLGTAKKKVSEWFQLRSCLGVRSEAACFGYV